MHMGPAIAPGVPATILALERHVPAPTPATYPTALPPAAQPLAAPVGAGGLRPLLVPRATNRVFLQLAAENTARNIETCARAPSPNPSPKPEPKPKPHPEQVRDPRGQADPERAVRRPAARAQPDGHRQHVPHHGRERSLRVPPRGLNT